ncbi:beta-ketoacyl synthase chain length factor [Coralloluteibacterium thermophilus]|uniref:Beta-ketoacyl synthase chain length factor n=1 Tax=Coralloluteibacterium thermophilum TaxID=2707049 RepID=A0ABV9NJK4_9GAMM
MQVGIEGVGFWGDGIPDWDAARRFLADGTLPAEAPRRPAPRMLAPNERRRAPDTVALALVVAEAACTAAGRDPAALPSVFASTHGELAITDHLCEALAHDPLGVSPTRFHNSVHNAAAGYWTIGTRCLRAATALSAYTATFAQGLLEAAVQVAAAGEPVLLVAYDAPARGALGQVARSEGLLAAAFVLAPPAPGVPTLSLALSGPAPAAAPGALAARYAANAMAPMLPFVELLAGGHGRAALPAGPASSLHVELSA